jgi:SAM-dependent methyltransferase
MTTDPRLHHEISHGQYSLEHGEEVWNWSSPAGKIRWARRCGLFADFLGTGRKLVLEIGCGTGLFTKELVKTGHTIVAIDISDALIRKAEKRIASANVHFISGNAYNTDFPLEHFDFIVGSSSLHHLDVEKALKEFFRILKPGGKIFFTEPNMLNPQVALIKNVPFLKRKSGDSPDETAFLRWRIAGAFRRYGFTDIQAIPFDFLHPHLPEAFIKKGTRLTLLLEKIPAIKEFAGSLIIRCRKPEVFQSTPCKTKSS